MKFTSHNQIHLEKDTTWRTQAIVYHWEVVLKLHARSPRRTKKLSYLDIKHSQQLLSEGWLDISLHWGKEKAIQLGFYFYFFRYRGPYLLLVKQIFFLKSSWKEIQLFFIYLKILHWRKNISPDKYFSRKETTHLCN